MAATTFLDASTSSRVSSLQLTVYDVRGQVLRVTDIHMDEHFEIDMAGSLQIARTKHVMLPSSHFPLSALA